MKILAIETSCDETAIAIIDGARDKRKPRFEVLAQVVASQIAVHRPWGGVVPNLAKREHQKNLVPLLLQVLKEAKKDLRFKKDDPRMHESKILNLKSILGREPELLEQFQKHISKPPQPDIDTMVVTQGPGLEPALWVGVNFARALSALWDIPLVGINHMEGHIAIALLQESNGNPKAQSSNPKKIRKQKKPKTISYNLSPITYPAVALLVSGGHTEIVLMKKAGAYEIVGETRDDAVGEAFDKVALMLGLSYPGGPEISREAEKTSGIKSRDIRIKLPRPMLANKDLDFSFSGLKTAVLYLVRDLKKQGADIKKIRPTIAREFQDAVVEVLTKKTLHAIKDYKARTFILGGGVAANKQLRTRLTQEIEKDFPRTAYYLPPTTLTGDNALMIATAAYLHELSATKSKKTNRLQAWKTMRPEANLRIDTLPNRL